MAVENRLARLAGLVLEGPDADGVLRLRLDSGVAGGRMTADQHRSLSRVWAVVAARDDVRCVLVSGRDGDLCPGADPAFVVAAAQAGAEARAAMVDEARAIVVGLLDLEVPVVCALRGRAYGAALALALLADVCVVAPDAQLADGHARLQVPAGDHAVLVWPLLLGMARAKRHLLLPEALSGEQAHALGMVAECVAAERVDAHAAELATRLARQSPWAVRWTKRALHHWYRQALPAFESSLAHELLAYATPPAVAAAEALAAEGAR